MTWVSSINKSQVIFRFITHSHLSCERENSLRKISAALFSLLHCRKRLVFGILEQIDFSLGFILDECG
jgi:hypothetical protein